MKTFTTAQRAQLIENHKTNLDLRALDGVTTDLTPVVKLFVAVGGSATWLLTEFDPENNSAFGLCDLGHGYPELGYVRVDDLEALGWRLERDLYFTATKPISEYATEAHIAGRVTA